MALKDIVRQEDNPRVPVPFTGTFGMTTPPYEEQYKVVTIYYTQEQLDAGKGARDTAAQVLPYANVGEAPSADCVGFQERLITRYRGGKVETQVLQLKGRTSNTVGPPPELSALNGSGNTGRPAPNDPASGWAYAQVGLPADNPVRQWLDATAATLENVRKTKPVIEAAITAYEAGALFYLNATEAAIKAALDAVAQLLETIRFSAHWTAFTVPYGPNIPNLDATSVNVLKAAYDWMDPKDIIPVRPGGAQGLLRYLESSLNGQSPDTPYLPPGTTVAGVSLVAGTTLDLSIINGFLRALRVVMQLFGGFDRAGKTLFSAWDGFSWPGNNPAVAPRDVRYTYSGERGGNGVFQVRWREPTLPADSPLPPGTPGDMVAVRFQYPPQHLAIWATDDAAVAATPPGPATRWVALTGSPHEPYIRVRDNPVKLYTPRNPSDLHEPDRVVNLVDPLGTYVYSVARADLETKFTASRSEKMPRWYLALALRNDAYTVQEKRADGYWSTYANYHTYAPVRLELIPVSAAGTMSASTTLPQWWGGAVLDGGWGRQFKDAAKETIRSLSGTVSGMSDLVKRTAKMLRDWLAALDKIVAQLEEIVRALRDLASFSMGIYGRAFLYPGRLDATSAFNNLITPINETSPEPPTGKEALLQEYRMSLGALPFQGPEDLAAGVFVVLNTIGVPADVVKRNYVLLASLFGMKVDPNTLAWTTERTQFDGILDNLSRSANEIWVVPEVAQESGQTGAVAQGLGESEVVAVQNGYNLDWNCPPLLPPGIGAPPTDGRLPPAVPTESQPVRAFTDDFRPIF